jgi:hypothetical protein
MRERHRTVNVAIKKMSHLEIFLEGDWIKVYDPRLEEEHWMPAHSCVRMEPKNISWHLINPDRDPDPEPEPKKRGRPKKK